VRPLIVLLGLLSAPNFAAQYTPWPGHDTAAPPFPIQRVWSDDDDCCRWCEVTEKPCGDRCIPYKDSCRRPPGCACTHK
jgi:hypothetical protein